MQRSRRRFLGETAAIAAGFAIVRAPARAAQFQYKLATDLPNGHPITVAAAEFSARVRTESNGRLDFQLFPDSVLGGDNAMMSQVRLGSIHVNICSGDILSAVVQAAGMERVGFAFPNNKAALAAMDGDLGDYIRRELKAKGILALNGFWENGFRQIATTTHPIRNADDLAGVKIRVPAAAINADLFRAFGASPVALDGHEMYPALQTHVVDGMEGSYSNIYSLRMYEVTKYLSVTNHQWNGFWAIMNPGAWDALPPDLQTIVQRNAARAGARESRSAEVADGSFADKLHRLGMQVTVADAATFKPRLTEYYARLKTYFGATPWSLLEKYVGKLG